LNFQGSLGLGFAIGEGPSHLFGEQGICIKSITPGGVAEQVLCFCFYYRLHKNKLVLCNRLRTEIEPRKLRMLYTKLVFSMKVWKTVISILQSATLNGGK
jgi:hypothetical protein